MRPLLEYKKRAVTLRKQGYTYREILREIPVAKSTLSLWLHEVGLAKRIQWVLTEKARLAGLRGGQARYRQRVERTKLINKESSAEVGCLSSREKWLIGVALYWAEGAKQKIHNTSAGVAFSNTDPLMIQFFRNWIRKSIGIPEEDISYELYIHDSHRYRVDKVLAYWKIILQVVDSMKIPTYYKSAKVKTNRKKRW